MRLTVLRLFQDSRKQVLNTFYYLIASACGAFASIFTLPLFTNKLSAEEFGIFGFCTTLNSVILPLIIFSLNSYFLKENFNQNKTEFGNKRVLNTLISATFFSGLLITLFLVFVGPKLFSKFNIQVAFYPNVFIILLSNILISFSTYGLLIYRIRQMGLAFALISLSQVIVNYGLSIILVMVCDFGIQGRIIGFGSGSLFIGVLTAWFFRKEFSFEIDWKILAKGIKFSFPLVVVALLSVLIESGDRFLIERLGTLSELGVYNIANQYALSIMIVGLALYKAFEPSFFEYLSVKKYQKIINGCIIVLIPILIVVLVLVIIAPFLINILTNALFNNSVQCAQILTMSYIFKIAAMFTGIILMVESRTTKMLISYAVSMLVFIPTSIYFYRYLSIEGIAIAKVFPFYINAVSNIFLSANWFQFNKLLVILSTLLVLVIVLSFSTIL